MIVDDQMLGNLNFDPFPMDVLIEILQRVPAKSLVRFTLVAKSWHYLITSSYFIKKHIAAGIQKRNQNSQILMKRYTYYGKKVRYSLHSDEEDDNGGGEGGSGRRDSFVLNSTALFVPPTIQKSHNYEHYSHNNCLIVGICNGLVSLYDNRKRNVSLWNPMIRKHISLPTPNLFYNLMFNSAQIWGFGADLHNDYKMVRILYSKNYEFPIEVEVYNLNLGFWRIINSVGLQSIIYSTSAVFLNGIVHWIGQQWFSSTNVGIRHWSPVKFYLDGRIPSPNTCYCSLIVGFEMDNEKFIEIMLPNELAREEQRSLHIRTSYNGGGNSNSSSFSSSSIVVMLQRNRGESCIIWVMKEYGVMESWIRMYSIDCTTFGMSRVVGFRRNGNILIAMKSNELVTYNPNNGDIKKIGMRGTHRSFYVSYFFETLALLDQVCTNDNEMNE